MVFGLIHSAEVAWPFIGTYHAKTFSSATSIMRAGNHAAQRIDRVNNERQWQPLVSPKLER